LSHEQSFLTIQNVKNDNKNSFYRSNTNNEVITISFDGLQGCNLVGFVHENFEENANVSISYRNSNVEVYNSGNISNFQNVSDDIDLGYFCHRTPTLLINQIVIMIAQTSKIQISKIVAGEALVIENVNSADIELIDESLTSRTESGSLLVNEKIIFKKLGLSLQNMIDKDSNKVLRIFNTIGSRNFIFCSISQKKNNFNKNDQIFGLLDRNQLSIANKYQSSSRLSITEF